MIEAQQRVIDGTAAPRVRPMTGDKALILFNRLAQDEVLIGDAARQAAEEAPGPRRLRLGLGEQKRGRGEAARPRK